MRFRNTDHTQILQFSPSVNSHTSNQSDHVTSSRYIKSLRSRYSPHVTSQKVTSTPFSTSSNVGSLDRSFTLLSTSILFSIITITISTRLIIIRYYLYQFILSSISSYMVMWYSIYLSLLLTLSKIIISILL